MKSALIAALIAIGASAVASTTEYGPNSYVKTVRVCGYAKSGSASNCKMMTYRFFAPRIEKVCRRLGKSGAGPQKCFNRLTTGNYGYRKFDSREEARRVHIEENN